jgi:hypothetical protein
VAAADITDCHPGRPRPPQVIKANDDLTPEHHQFFLYQMLRGLKYIHSGAAARWCGGRAAAVAAS